MKLLLTDCATLRFENDLPLDIFEQFGDVTYCEGLFGDELIEAVRDVDIILCNKTVISREVLNAAKSLKYIGLFATGYNNIDIEAAREHNVVVCNAGSYSTSAVAQQVFAYILDRYSSVAKYNELVKNGGWISSPTFSMLRFPTDELAGKVIGIIGYGSIGKKVAKIAAAFDMQVLAYTRTAQEDAIAEFVSLDELLNKSDIITLHCPLNDQSRYMLNRSAFQKVKKGAFLINTARGPIVDEQALCDALKEERLSGAAVDVLETEPMKKDCPLMNAPNIMITPHVAWAPLTTRMRLLNIVSENIQAFLEGKPTNVVS